MYFIILNLVINEAGTESYPVFIIVIGFAVFVYFNLMELPLCKRNFLTKAILIYRHTIET